MFEVCLGSLSCFHPLWILLHKDSNQRMEQVSEEWSSLEQLSTALFPLLRRFRNCYLSPETTTRPPSFDRTFAHMFALPDRALDPADPVCKCFRFPCTVAMVWQWERQPSPQVYVEICVFVHACESCVPLFKQYTSVITIHVMYCVYNRVPIFVLMLPTLMCSIHECDTVTLSWS